MQSNVTTVTFDQIALDDTFSMREQRRKVDLNKQPKGRVSGTHLQHLRTVLKNGGLLDPVKLWQEVDGQGGTTGRLVVLDGRYRIAAYRAEQATKDRKKLGKKPTPVTIPARIYAVTKAEALLIALQSNSKETLPLTYSERSNAAWRMVWEFGDSIPKPRLAAASGISPRTILTMRRQRKAFRDANDTPSLDWRKDLRWPKEVKEYCPPTDEQKAEMVTALAKGFRQTLNSNFTKDLATLADALEEALGIQQMRYLIDYLRTDGGDEIFLEEDDLKMDPRGSEEAGF
ncbi:hypothetical protein R3X27_15480 [Tropicimonas sp. TH_r6]|uniref:hypothetical protein n=1 Tax=Tropicimonas sp. TH_r6 TaxID=3082085 RepID=UPI0029530B65|nr:hypothetical protein [Tropicimonas sp. TH_r6]MDV7144089.1 hypothetical protein [Tropicimonas sp. TH_r6]